MSIRTSVAGTLILAFAVVACGRDDGDGGGGGGGGNGSGAAAKTACNTYCDATASCPLFAYTDAAECKSYECDGLEQLPDACATTFKNYYECVNAKSDKCDETGCEPDLNACM